MKTWISDDNGNRCSVEYWGSEEKAREALATLTRCFDCSDCSRCSDCSGCSRCLGCSGCSDCSDCSDCFGCSDCSRCSDCSDCSACYACYGCFDCSRCSDCSACYACYGCFDCSRRFDCFGCSGCSRCYGCSGCSDCSDCSRCSDCFGKNGIDEAAVAVPIIDDLHRKVYEAVSQRQALNMSAWHTCDTTHCRAGWVVTLAGEAGKALERKYRTALAAMMIYDTSCPDYQINPCRFFDSEEEALADMRKLAMQ